MKNDITNICKSNKIVIKADKTGNHYYFNVDKYHKAICKEAKQNLKKLNGKIILITRQKIITRKLKIDGRMDNYTCCRPLSLLRTIRIISPIIRSSDCLTLPKTKQGRLARLYSIVPGNMLGTPQGSTNGGIQKYAIIWFSKIKKKDECTFIQYGISNFYPSITEDLLVTAINLIKNYCTITDEGTNIIKQAQKHIIFHDGSMWTKKDNPNFYIARFVYYYCGDLDILLLATTLVCKEMTSLSSDVIPTHKNRSPQQTTY